MEYFDLTQPLTAGMPVVPGDPPVEITRVRSHDIDGYEVARICLGSHSGTHIDAPRHFFPDGRPLDSFPLERLIAPGVVVDCRVAAAPPVGAPTVGAAPLISAAQLAERLQPFAVPRGGMVLLHTEGALLSLEAAQLLLDHGVGLVGIDGPGLDEEPYRVHALLLGHDVLLAENLRGLDRLGPGPVMCACLPLAFAGADGGPARVVAWR